ncbi:uncharacterized protein LOC131929646 [Physella acuta]|uniref:uncharacterized protein LOC131929646 n=1 Tax=Physella acuta TaxID=109671 RepID=UPI0027DC956C|nr:uncharacterized protein LOC131929646 [Physella acuta]
MQPLSAGLTLLGDDISFLMRRIGEMEKSKLDPRQQETVTNILEYNDTYSGDLMLDRAQEVRLFDSTEEEIQHGDEEYKANERTFLDTANLHPLNQRKFKNENESEPETPTPSSFSLGELSLKTSSKFQWKSDTNFSEPPQNTLTSSNSTRTMEFDGKLFTELKPINLRKITVYSDATPLYLDPSQRGIAQSSLENQLNTQTSDVDKMTSEFTGPKPEELNQPDTRYHRKRCIGCKKVNKVPPPPPLPPAEVIDAILFKHNNTRGLKMGQREFYKLVVTSLVKIPEYSAKYKDKLNSFSAGDEAKENLTSGVADARTPDADYEVDTELKGLLEELNTDTSQTNTTGEHQTTDNPAVYREVVQGHSNAQNSSSYLQPLMAFLRSGGQGLMQVDLVVLLCAVLLPVVFTLQAV